MVSSADLSQGGFVVAPGSIGEPVNCPSLSAALWVEASQSAPAATSRYTVFMESTPDSNDQHGPSRREILTGRALASTAETGQGQPQPAAAKDSYVYQVSRKAMACDFEITLPIEQAAETTEAALAALDEVERLEQQLSVFLTESEVSRLNRAAAERAMAVEPELWNLLARCHQLWRETEGAFDITSTPLSRSWGFYRRQGQLASQQEIDQALEAVGSQWLQLNEANQTVEFSNRGLEINLGSIGKGYALDIAAGSLEMDGSQDFIIHGGHSSILARGSRHADESSPAGWRIALRHPTRPQQRLLDVTLLDQAAGTSGSANQFFHHQGQRYSHILDPRTGWPAEHLLSATVLAPTAADADALATAFFVMGIESTERFLVDRPGISAILTRETSRASGTEIHLLGLESTQWTPLTDNVTIIDHSQSNAPG